MNLFSLGPTWRTTIFRKNLHHHQNFLFGFGDIFCSRVPVLGSPIPAEILNRPPPLFTSTTNELSTTTTTRIPFHRLPLCSAQLPGPCRRDLFYWIFLVTIIFISGEHLLLKPASPLEAAVLAQLGLSTPRTRTLSSHQGTLSTLSRGTLLTRSSKEEQDRSCFQAGLRFFFKPSPPRPRQGQWLPPAQRPSSDHASPLSSQIARLES